MTKHKRAMGDAIANVYARSQGLNPDFFVRAFIQYFPDAPIYYQARRCEYCKREFAYSKKTQRFCEPKCGADQKRDREYFGGNRRKTVGLAEGTCQICYSKPFKGLASHHVYGKVKDPKGENLVALCPGCHDLVTKLGSRVFLTDPEVWNNLIEYANLRKYGVSTNLRVILDTMH